MNLRSATVVIALALLGAFTLLNWTAFTAPTTLSLGFAEVQAPLGLVMLIVTAFLCVLFLAYIVFQQAGVIREARRMSKELKAQRELADSAEASRFTELRGHIAQELADLAGRGERSEQALTERLDRLDASLLERIAESERSLSAFVAEVDDKLDRIHPPRPDA
ncbi:LapA family protein [uncultured Piscinibacter sp.]|uniref:LapA family protein n=1 Tax=uncultured Piscinibacter sp. TaxID=1131835 RepID=UPI00262725CA|nr:LapA family protein [uncultured Piscinibacter sp.]